MEKIFDNIFPHLNSKQDRYAILYHRDDEMTLQKRRNRKLRNMENTEHRTFVRKVSGRAQAKKYRKANHTNQFLPH